MKYLIALTIFGLTLAAGIHLLNNNPCFPRKNCTDFTTITDKFDLNTIQISGWIPWWKEDEAYTLIAAYPTKFTSISPMWFYVDVNYELEERGRSARPKTLASLEIKELGLELIPTLASDLTGDDLSVFLDPENGYAETFQQTLIAKLVELNVDGIDIDLEGIKSHNRNDFTLFLEKLRTLLVSRNLKLVVTVHAQTGNYDSEISKGQDLEEIAKLADEVRVMIYDRHGKFSDAGAIAPYDWMLQVLTHSLKKIPREKLVVGLPSYGYLWETSGVTHSFQYDEFTKYLVDNYDPGYYSHRRDPLSGELIYVSDSFHGWLSDSESILLKMKLAHSLGLTRFVIWSLGGMDVTLFDH